MRVVCALRGASGVRNEEASIREQAALLYDELLSANGLEEKDLISLIFSVTQDINALNPATALRESGRASELPLMVFQEAAFVNSPPGGFIRALLHCYREEGRPPRHVYRNGAEGLRRLIEHGGI